MVNSNSTTNPYQAPDANVSNSSNETYQPQLFSTKGRIGRLRYLAYCLASYLVIIPFLIIAAILSSSYLSNSNTSLNIIFLAYIPLFIFYFIIAKRRFNDVNASGWLNLLIFIPLIGSFVILYLIFARGTDGPNKYGPAPCENSTGVKFAACLMIFVPLIGILAAIALPAYSDYVERAKQSQHS